VLEVDTKALPYGRDNRAGNAMTTEETPLLTAEHARRDLNPAAARRWVVVNPLSLNSLGRPAGYALLPGENTPPFLSQESPLRKRAPFVNHHLWVTPFDPEQVYPAGDYPNQSAGGGGIDRWTSAEEPLTARDLVLWYTLGVTHIPRPEEWPVMPATKIGFKLAPVGFFGRNPALDVPRPAAPKRKK
jgi:primary-amine oxidase